jgi:diguanylate cyclase (GGDEF)-like protein
MTRESKLRFLNGLLAPGCVLLLAAWSLNREPVVRDAVLPYAAYFCFGTLAAAVLLSWYHDQARLLGVASALALAVWTLERWPDNLNGAAPAATFLLPLNFVFFASSRERGVLSLDGAFKVGIVAAQTAVVAWMVQADRAIGSLLRLDSPLGEWSSLPLLSQLSFAVAAVTLLALISLRRTKVEQGLFLALIAVFLGVQNANADTLLLYAGTAGLVLVFAVLEHGYDIAYRDELTGLLGRRAFTSMMENLGRTYTFAMCDVDNFKKFNDTYGHDVGDDVLKMVAAKLSHVEGGGRVFRYGGEEFLVVFRGRSAIEAHPFMESVRQAIAETDFVMSRDRRSRRSRHRSGGEKGQTVTVTISIGLADKSMRHSTPDLVLDAADAALYDAKAAGRNCVRLDETTLPPQTQRSA